MIYPQKLDPGNVWAKVSLLGANKVAHIGKEPSCRCTETQETWVRSLGWEDPLEEGIATHSSILAWRIPMDRGAWWVPVHGVTKNLARLSD